MFFSKRHNNNDPYRLEGMIYFTDKSKLNQNLPVYC